MKRVKYFQYISYDLLLEGSEHEQISISHRVDVFQYNAPYLFYLIPLNLVGFV